LTLVIQARESGAKKGMFMKPDEPCATKRRIAFLFAGNGPQYRGKYLSRTVPAARELFDQAAEILGYDLAELCDHDPGGKLSSMVISDPAIFVSTLAALESLRATNPEIESECVAAAGMSLGEYTAVVFAGAMSFSDGLRVVMQRGQAIEQAANATPGGMVMILGLKRAQVEQLCARARTAGPVYISYLLGPGSIFISGVTAAIEMVERLAPEMEALITKRLPVRGALHTELMEPAKEHLAQVLAAAEIRTPRIPVWSNVDAQPHTSPDEIRSLLMHQVLQRVHWHEMLRNLLAAGVEQFQQIGSDGILEVLLKEVKRG
jgi:[acyl-carrier-protein] S-malonyltransferase